jgi:hypothetical protein
MWVLNRCFSTYATARAGPRQPTMPIRGNRFLNENVFKTAIGVQ